MSPAIAQTKRSPKRGDARTQAILDAAVELLSEVGYDRMTMDTVAARARASKATIYRHWPDKKALVLAALHRTGSVVPEVPDSGSLRGDLESYVRQAVAATAGATGSLMTGLLAVAARDPELSALLSQQFHYEQLPMITELVDRARARGEVSAEVDPVVISEVLPGVLIMHILVLGLPGDKAFIRRLVDGVLVPLLTSAGRARADKSAS
jgi:AcrR family transcriptional regulator